MLLSILQNSVHKEGPDVYLDLSEKDAVCKREGGENRMERLRQESEGS